MKDINLLILNDKEGNSIRLLVDADMDNINILSSVDLNEAMEICLKDHISIVIVDTQIPDINGFEFVSLLHSNPKTSHIMTILLTDPSKEDERLSEVVKNGTVDLLHKPLNTNMVHAKIMSFIRQIRLQKELAHKNQELEITKKELSLAKEKADHARQSKEIFLANMSHEIRTPINGIMGIIHMFKSSVLTKDQVKWLGMLENASQSLLALINDILDLSRIDSEKVNIEKKDFLLSKFIDNLDHTFRPKAEHKGLDFVIHRDANLPQYVLFDSLHLQQIIGHFMSNSLKFTAKGRITLHIKLIETQANGYRIRFSVEDTGIGIPAGHLPKIFQAFEQGDGAITKRYGGTGLGLTIVKKLSDLLDGNVGAESTPRKGSVFYIEAYFEKGSAPKEKKASEPYINFPKLSGTSVLVAEDNDLNAFMLVHMLKTWGCKVDAVKNGRLALSYVNKKHYDIILMDTHMPIMSGSDAIKLIRKHQDPEKQQIPIITISASILEHEQAAAYDVGADHVIGKPFEPADLYNKIKISLDKRRQ